MMTEVYQGRGVTERVLKARVMGRWLHLHRMRPPDEVAGVTMEDLVLADAASAAKSCAWFQILAVGEKCRHFTQGEVGGMVYLPLAAAGKRDWCHPVGENELMCRESYFEEDAEEDGVLPRDRIERPPLAVFWR